MYNELLSIPGSLLKDYADCRVFDVLLKDRHP